MKRVSVLLIAAIGMMLMSACAAAAEESAATAPAPEAAATEAPVDTSNVLFTITRADGSTYDVTLDAVKALPLAQVQAEGKTEEGPYLKDVLALAGVTEFTEVTLTGSSSPATLTFEQVDENTILDFNNHGTMKLSSTYIPKADWTKDVAEIVVK
jgi:hypothetical protein